MQNRLTALERRVATTEAAVTIPTHGPGNTIPGSGSEEGGGGDSGDRGRRFIGGGTTAGFTVGEAVKANGQVDTQSTDTDQSIYRSFVRSINHCTMN